MRIKYLPNKVNSTTTWEIELNNGVTTLIWGNGSWKSAILEAIFKETYRNEDHLTIAYSSGQNESFSKIVSTYLKQQIKDDVEKRKLENDFEAPEIDNERRWAFYFNYKWANLLIFFASIYKGEWLVRW
jgi:hypothetical protein